jgi:hypothetical protein
VSSSTIGADLGLRPRKVVGVLVAVAAAAAVGSSVALLFSLPGCDGTSSAPCDERAPLYAGTMVVGIALCVLASFIGAGFLAFALTCLSLGTGSIAGGASADMGAFPVGFGAVWLAIGIAQVGFFLWIRPRAIARRNALAHLRAHGLPGEGVVTAVQDTGVTMNDDPMVALTLQVTPDGGGGRFQRSAQTFVSRTAIPRVGDRYRVRFDPTDSAQVLLEEARPAQP